MNSPPPGELFRSQFMNQFPITWVVIHHTDDTDRYYLLIKIKSRLGRRRRFHRLDYLDHAWEHGEVIDR